MRNPKLLLLGESHKVVSTTLDMSPELSDDEMTRAIYEALCEHHKALDHQLAARGVAIQPGVPVSWQGHALNPAAAVVLGVLIKSARAKETRLSGLLAAA